MTPGRAYTFGHARAEALVLSEPISFWGGVDAATGDIVDRSHPQLGANVTGKILVMPCGRGSSSSSSVLAEALRRGTGPRGFVLARPDPILIVAAIVAKTLYGIACPIVVSEIQNIDSGAEVEIHAPAGEAATVNVRG